MPSRAPGGSAVQRHPKCEPGLLWRRSHFEVAPVRLGDLGGDVQIEAQAVLAWLRLTSEERLKETFHCRWRDRLAAVCDPQFQFRTIGRGVDPDGFAGG